METNKETKETKEEPLENLTINIYLNSDGDYNYDIYRNPEDIENGVESFDGGCCTGSLTDALGMATEQAEGVIADIGELE